MLAYIKNILPRVQQYSNKLDKVEHFVDKKWLLIDDNENSHSYEFLRDGRLVMTLVTNNGTSQETQMGSWELLPTKRLLISRSQGLLTLEQGFLGDGLLILKESGTSNIPFSCYNPDVIPDGDVKKYFEQYFEVKKAAQLANSQGKDGLKRNPDGSLYSGTIQDYNDSSKYLVYGDGKLLRYYFVRVYATDKGNITIEQEYDNNIIYNDIVRQGQDLAGNGEYKFTNPKDIKLADCNSVFVKDGRVAGVKDTTWIYNFFVIVGILAVLIALIVLAQVGNH